MDGFHHRRRRKGCGCGCSGCFTVLFAMGMVLVTGVIPLLAISMSRGDSDAAALAAFSDCAAVTDRLGTPIERSVWSFPSGESSSGGSSGSANWTIRLEGPRGSGSGWYSARYSGGGPWEISMATVDFGDGRKVTAVPCETDKAKPEEPRPRKPRPDKPDKRKKKGKSKRR